jgi:hypothetical protein
MNMIMRELVLLVPFAPVAAAFVLAVSGAYVGE